MTPVVAALFVIIGGATAWRTLPYRSVAMDVECGNYRSKDIHIAPSGPKSVIVVRATKEQHLSNNFNCTLHIRLPSNSSSKLAYSLTMVDIPHSCLSSLKVWGGSQSKNNALRWCETYDEPRGRRGGVFNDTSMYIKLFTSKEDWNWDRLGFEIIVTAYRENVFNRCFREEFECRGGKRCIFHKFACDHHNNCGDASDEECGISGLLSLIVIITCALMLVVLIACLIRRIRRRRRQLPYDTSRATSTQSMQSDNSLFGFRHGQIVDPYYRPLYPIGEGTKLKLDNLFQDPDDPLLPAHYLAKKRLSTKDRLSSESKLPPAPSGTPEEVELPRSSRHNSMTQLRSLNSTDPPGAHPKPSRRCSFPPDDRRQLRRLHLLQQLATDNER